MKFLFGSPFQQAMKHMNLLYNENEIMSREGNNDDDSQN